MIWVFLLKNKSSVELWVNKFLKMRGQLSNKFDWHVDLNFIDLDTSLWIWSSRLIKTYSFALWEDLKSKFISFHIYFSSIINITEKKKKKTRLDVWRLEKIIKFYGLFLWYLITNFDWCVLCMRPFSEDLKNQWKKSMWVWHNTGCIIQDNIFRKSLKYISRCEMGVFEFTGRKIITIKRNIPSRPDHTSRCINIKHEKGKVNSLICI